MNKETIYGIGSLLFIGGFIFGVFNWFGVYWGFGVIGVIGYFLFFFIAIVKDNEKKAGILRAKLAARHALRWPNSEADTDENEDEDDEDDDVGLSQKSKAAKKGWLTRRANKLIKTSKFKVGRKRVEGRKLRVIQKTKTFDIVEMQPHVRTVAIRTYNHNTDNYEEKRIQLALPFIQYILYKSKKETGTIQLSFSNKPATLASDVYFPPFPNIYPGSHHTCVDWPDGVVGVEDRITHFWNTWFTPANDEWVGSVALSDCKLRSYKKWEKMTKKKPLGFILEIKWKYPAQLKNLKKLHGRDDLDEGEFDEFDDDDDEFDDDLEYGSSSNVTGIDYNMHVTTNTACDD